MQRTRTLRQRGQFDPDGPRGVFWTTSGSWNWSVSWLRCFGNLQQACHRHRKEGSVSGPGLQR